MKNADPLYFRFVWTESECEWTYKEVLERVCIMRWDSELEEGVLAIIWCSGVVTGPNMLTTDKWNISTVKGI